MGFDDAVTIEVAILAAVELDAADDCRLGRGAGRVGVPFTVVSRLHAWMLQRRRHTRRFDELAAILRHVEWNTLYDDFVMCCWSIVSRARAACAVCHAAEVVHELDTFAVVDVLLLLAPRLLNGFGTRLALLLVYGRVDELEVAVGLGNPRARRGI